MSDVGEITILEEGDAIITNRRVVIGTKTYAMSDINSVTVMKTGSIYGCVIVALIIGGLLLGLFSFASDNYASQIRLLAFMLFGGALVVAILAPPSYAIRIRGAAGQADILQSMDKDYLDRIVVAMNAALTG